MKGFGKFLIGAGIATAIGIGVYKISKAENPPPPPPPPPTSRVAPLNGRGDINGDGVIDSTDIDLYERIILGMYPASFASDLWGTGRYDIGGVTQLERYILGLFDEFPADR